MKDIVYVGDADTRCLSADDFERMGVTHKGIDFTKGVAVEVSNELSEALLSSIAVRREFAEADATNTYPEDLETPVPPKLVAGSTTPLLVDPDNPPPVGESATVPDAGAPDASATDSGANEKAGTKPQGKAKASGS